MRSSDQIQKNQFCPLPPPSSWSLGSVSGPSAPWFSMDSSSLSSKRGVVLRQQGINCSWYIRNNTAIGTGSWERKISFKLCIMGRNVKSWIKAFAIINQHYSKFGVSGINIRSRYA